jgi:lysophospholipase III
MMLYWLNNYIDQKFKDKYLKGMVSIAAVWGGAVKTLRLMASGDNIDVFVVRPLTVRPYQQSATSTAFLMPSPAFWSEYDVIVSRPTKNYTVKNYQEFFTDIGFTDGFEMRVDTQNLIYDLKPPNIELHLIYGTGLKTPEQFVYTEAQWPDSQPSVFYGDGDGTVNLRSLLGYQRWFTKQKQKILFKELPGAEHLAILKNQNVTDYILNLVQSD